MAIQKTITLDEYVFDNYLSDVQGNFSKHIQKLVMLGYEALNGDAVENKKKIVSLIHQNEDLIRENKELKLNVLRLKKRGMTGTYDDIIDKYGIQEDDLQVLRICKAKIQKDPKVYFDGNFNLFKNTTGKMIRHSEFQKLLDGLDQDKITKFESPLLSTQTKNPTQAEE